MVLECTWRVKKREDVPIRERQKSEGETGHSGSRNGDRARERGGAKSQLLFAMNFSLGLCNWFLQYWEFSGSKQNFGKERSLIWKTDVRLPFKNMFPGWFKKNHLHLKISLKIGKILWNPVKEFVISKANTLCSW